MTSNPDDDYYWKIRLTDNDEFNLFIDEITPLMEELRKLPYGLIALLLSKIKGIKDGTAKIEERNLEFFNKMFYLMTGVLITKNNKQLFFEEKEIDKLNEIFHRLGKILAKIELYYSGDISVKRIDNNWIYSLTELGNKRADKLADTL